MFTHFIILYSNIPIKFCHLCEFFTQFTQLENAPPQAQSGAWSSDK